MFREPLLVTLDRYYSHPVLETLSTLFDALNGIPLNNLPRPNIVEQRLMHWGISPHHPPSTSTSSPPQTHANTDYALSMYTPSNWFHTLSLELFDSSTLRLQYPLFSTPDDVGCCNLSLLTRTFRDNTMKIFHAILTKKRVMFVGYDHAAGDVCQMVLSAVGMVSPPLNSVIRRAFPYANLSDLSFLEVRWIRLYSLRDSQSSSTPSPVYLYSNTPG